MKILYPNVNKLNISLFVNRKSNYVHLGLDMSLLSARVSSELITIIRNFEKREQRLETLLCFTQASTYDKVEACLYRF